tara:strand:+ start:356 stop:586 length:231 start_codon:yes stop_codon:yes gene_type:complete
MLKLSNEALGAIMMALQKSLFEQTDIVPVLQGFEFVADNDTLYVKNPPVVNLADFALEEDEPSSKMDPFDTPLEEG